MNLQIAAINCNTFLQYEETTFDSAFKPRIKLKIDPGMEIELF